MESSTVGTPFADDLKTDRRDWTYGIISKIAYLIGVPLRIFQNVYEPPQIELFHQLEREKTARIVRHLCIIRTAIERNFHDINNKMQLDYVTPTSMPEFIPQESINQLTSDGISFIKKSNKLLVQHIFEINRIISDRINNCQKLFPSWINWSYIRDLFIMPDGLSSTGTSTAAQTYYQSRKCYPYKMYINWCPCNEGNILFNDQKFLALLYYWHNDEFTDYSRLAGGNHVRDVICDYVMASEKTVVLVDCNNSDPYKLSAALNRLDTGCRKLISSIVLFEDGQNASAWSIVEHFTDIPVEHGLTEIVKRSKTLTGAIRLISRAYQEHYENHVDSFIVISDDPEHWELVSSLPKAHSLVIVERGKCNSEAKQELLRSGIPFCYIDDAYSGDSDEVKFIALFQALYQYIGQSVRLNINKMLETALQTAQMEMTAAERQNFFTKYIETMRMTIDANGDVVLKLNCTLH